MNEKNKIAVKVIIGLILIGSGIYILTKPKAVVKDKNYWINNIVSYTTKQGSQADSNILSGFDEGFLQAWSNAIDSSYPTFNYINGIGSLTYNTSTGTRKI